MGLIRTYSELITLDTFEERYEYLRLGGRVGEETFGFDRYLNQILYHSDEWQKLRRKIILRDNACDLGIPGREIEKYIIIHHMNSISKEDILSRSELVYDPEYLICTFKPTHLAIHYGDKSLLMTVPHERSRNDTCPWRK